MENWAATPKFDDMRMGRKGMNVRAQCLRRFEEAVEPARFLADDDESSRSLKPASRPSKRNVFRTCDLVQRCGVLLLAA